LFATNSLGLRNCAVVLKLSCFRVPIGQVPGLIREIHWHN
jgi:hypothetical protein